MTQEILKNLLPKFLDYLKTKSRSPSTILAYRADLEQLKNFLQSKNKVLVEQIVQSDLEAFRDTLLTEKYTPKSVSRKLNAVKTFFRWMISEHYITTDVSQSVAHPVELILQTGMRISEVAGLKTENVKSNQIKIESYATQPERTIPLNSPAKEALNSYAKIRPNKILSPYVFVSKNGKALAVRNIRASIDRYMQKAEIGKFSVNDLRTTFIVENLKNGVDIVLLSQVSGHKRLSTTERYLELAEIKEPGKKPILQEL